MVFVKLSTISYTEVLCEYDEGTSSVNYQIHLNMFY